MLQKSTAFPIFGFTDNPRLPHSDNSFHQGTALKFALAAGNTVSPPSSTSLLDYHQEELNGGHYKRMCTIYVKGVEFCVYCHMHLEIEIDPYRYISIVAILWPPFLVLKESEK